MIKRYPLKFDAGACAHELDVMLASTMWTRMRGLLGRPALQSGQAMLIRSCNLIHTVGMRYPIDVVFLRRDGMVVKVAAAVLPRRMRGSLRAQCVLELAAGEAERCAIAPGLSLPIAGLGRAR
jgi:uncharacterized protein